MAPVKPMGVRQDSNPKTKPGVTGFVQEYNEDPGPRQDLNPAAVTDPSVLPEPLETPTVPTPARTRGAASGVAGVPGSTRAPRAPRVPKAPKARK